MLDAYFIGLNGMRGGSIILGLGEGIMGGSITIGFCDRNGGG